MRLVYLLTLLSLSGCINVAAENADRAGKFAKDKINTYMDLGLDCEESGQGKDYCKGAVDRARPYQPDRYVVEPLYRPGAFQQPIVPHPLPPGAVTNDQNPQELLR